MNGTGSLIRVRRPMNQCIVRLGTNGIVFYSQKKSIYHGPKYNEKPLLGESQNQKPNSQSVADVLKSNTSNKLVSPEHMPQDHAETLLSDHPAMAILAKPAIIIQRQLEMMNVLLGFEQANKYTIMDPQGNHIGYLAEQEHGMANAVTRQLLRTHRGFTTHVLDREGQEVLRFYRPFSWIRSSIRIFDALSTSNLQPSENIVEAEKSMIQTQDISRGTAHHSAGRMRLIGEAQQQWAFLRRKYNLFTYRRNSSTNEWIADSPPLPNEASQAALSDINNIECHQSDGTLNQFAYVNEPFLSWDFTLLSAKGGVVGSVNRNFVGLARETFTDTGVYVLRMDAAGPEVEPKHSISQTARMAQVPTRSNSGMTLAQRAVMLATAVSIDFDYFSRKRGGFGVFPLWFPTSEAGAESASTGVTSQTASGSGTISGAQEAVGSLGTAAGRNVATGEVTSAGIGSIAGIEAARKRTHEDDNSISNDSSIPKDQSEDYSIFKEEGKSSSPGVDPYYRNRGESGDQVSGKDNFGDYLENGSKSGGGSNNFGSNQGSWLDWFDE